MQILRILAVESSAKPASIAVVRNETLEAYSFQNIGLTHSRTLMPVLADTLKNAGLSLSEIDAFAIAAGPGSFTGLRIGIATVKGLAFGADKPCIGVSTLEAMAENAFFLDGVLCCGMDARRGEVYNANFLSSGGTLTRLCEDRALPAEKMAEELRNCGKKIFCIGDGASLCYNSLRSIGEDAEILPAHMVYQGAYGVARLAMKKYSPDAKLSADDLTPVYIRLSQAEREKNEKTKNN